MLKIIMYLDEDKLLQEMHAHAAGMLLCTHIHQRTAIYRQRPHRCIY